MATILSGVGIKGDTVVPTIENEMKETRGRPEYNLQDAADYLHIKPATLCKYNSIGKIRYYKLGRCVYYKKHDLDYFIESQAVDPLKKVGALQTRKMYGKEIGATIGN
jgi:hypothetical protein